MWSISKTNSGREPVWAKSGGDLFYLQADGTVMAVGIGAAGPTAEPRLAGVGKFPIGVRGAGDPYWDTLPDGRFVVTQTVSNPAPRPIAVVINRTASLAAR